MIKNCHGELGINGIVRPLLMCIGLDTINVRIIKKVIIAPMLPKEDRVGDCCRKAIKIPIVISIPPVRLENIRVLNNAKAQEKKGLFSANGRIASASCLVNFNRPMPIKIKTSPYLMTEVKETIESIAAAVFITREFEFLNFRLGFVFYLLQLFVNFPTTFTFFTDNIK